jgi:predicted transposase YbfD/YdcC
LLILEGAIVTIDAMGCQTAIAEKIIHQQADYVLDDIQKAFEQHPKQSVILLQKNHTAE